MPTDHEARAEEIARRLDSADANQLSCWVNDGEASMLDSLVLPNRTPQVGDLVDWTRRETRVCRDGVRRVFAVGVVTPLGLAVANHLKGKTDE